MQEYLQDHKFKLASQAAIKLGVHAFVIGGYVRDIFLNRPSKDIDIVVLGDGIALANEVATQLPEKPKVNIFKTFGTAMIKTANWELEFVGARKESYKQHSRKPTVEPGTLEDDQNRRDFTINALALSLQPESFGELSDPFGGREDLDKGIIRTPLDPEITFDDDPLRMMRAIRFATQLNFEIAKDTLEAIEKYAERIEIVSKERIADELNKIILSPKPSIGFKLLFDTKLLHLIFPEMIALHGVEIINGKGHKDNFYHTLQVLDNICSETDDLWLRWSAILHDIAKPPTKRFSTREGWTFHGHEDKGARMVPQIFKNLRLPLNDKMKFVQKMVLLHLRPKALAEENAKDSAYRRLIVEAGNDLESLFILCRADITSRNAQKVTQYKQNLEDVWTEVKAVEERDTLRNWQPPIDGKEIMDTFNIRPGREIGVLKEAIKEAILEGEIENTHEAAMLFMLDKAKSLGLSRKKN